MLVKKFLNFLPLLTFALMAIPVMADQTVTLKTSKDMGSYAMGVELVRNWQRQGIDLDLDIVMKGMRDSLSGNRLLMSEPDLQTSLNMITSQLRQKKAQTRLTAMQDNKSQGEEFLAENKKKEGVVTLSSGLQYRILVERRGKKPLGTDTVECRIRGIRLNGGEFENTGATPKIFKIAEVIPAWREALKLMNEGSKWQIFTPPQLAYGQRGAGHIGPYETIIYEIELVSIQ